MLEAPPNPSPAVAIPLGRYQLSRVLGKGAMGEVWAARTRLYAGEVAVKVVLEHDPSDPWAVRALDNEVATAAVLDHPGVVGVLDHGRVDMVAHTASEGRLPLGGSYVVMERLQGQSLHDLIGRLSWPEVREVLRQLLDALGHCHARGVIHRDLKPGNLVVEPAGAGGGQRLRLSLMDFGLARFYEQPSPTEEKVAGTPAYMAPEQLQGDWQAQGPATDLYSVGCLGWTLITGIPPFGRRRSYEDFLHDHLHKHPPTLDPMIEVPASVEGWLLGLLAKSPLDRFRSAADARSALDRLVDELSDDPATLMPVAPPVRLARPDAEALSAELSIGDVLSTANLGKPPDSLPLLDDDTADVLAEVESGAVLPAAGTRPDTPRIPVPEQWRRAMGVARVSLTDVGVSIFGARAPRLVGRLDERDHLWSALREAEDSGAPRCVVIYGDPGTGKSRLASWLVQTAYELAGVESLQASWGAGRAGDGELARMFRRRLRLEGAPTQWIEGRLRQVLAHTGSDETEIPALVAALSPTTADDRSSPHMASPRERQVLFARLASALITEPMQPGAERVRPGIVWLDDLHQSTEGLQFVSQLVSLRDAGPVVVVCTLSEVPESPTRNRALGQMLASSRCSELQLGPLPEADHQALVESLLPFTPAVATSLVAHTASSPHFAVSVVADWVSRGVLEVADGGYTVPDEVLEEIPVDRAELARRTLHATLSTGSESQRVAMELAAVLGQFVDREEWRSVCVRSRVRPQPDILDEWTRLHLVERQPGGFSFAHPAVRQQLLQSARDGGRHARQHRICATIVELRSPPGPEMAGRVADHLLAAEDLRDAIAYLLQAAKGYAAMGQAEGVLLWLDRWEATAEAIALPDAAPDRSVAWVLRLDALWLLGSPDHEQATERLFAMAEDRRDLRGLAALHRALRMYQGGEFGPADTELRRAAHYAADDGHLMPRILLEQARLTLETGDLEGARNVLQSPWLAGARSPDPRTEATLSWLLGRIAKQQGNLAEARAAFEQAVQRFERLSDRSGLARCINELGELSRLNGDLEAAGEHYRNALRMMERLSSDNTDIVRVNLGLVLLARGAHDRARPLLEAALEAFRDSGRVALLATTRAALLPCAAHDGAWSEWDTLLLASGRDLKKSRFVDVDLAWLLERAAQVAFSVGQPLRADAALAMAEHQWAALDRPEDLTRVQQRRAARS